MKGWKYSNFKLSFSFWFLNAEIWEETGLLVCEYLFEGIKGGGACNVMLLLLELLACFFALHARIWMLEVLILIYFAQDFSIHDAKDTGTGKVYQSNFLGTLKLWCLRNQWLAHF